MVARKGERYASLRAFDAPAIVHWAAPYSSGYSAVFPEGELLEIASDPAPGASAVYCEPVRAKELLPWFIDPVDAQVSKYQGYSLVVDLAALQQHCRLFSGPGGPARKLDSPEIWREGEIALTGTSLLTPKRRYFLEGIRSVEVRQVRPRRTGAYLLLLLGVLSALALVGLALIAIALVWLWFLRTRNEVVIGYGGEKQIVLAARTRERAQRVAEAIPSA